MKQEIDVLLVDDDPDICTMVEAILKFAGYKVQYCSVPDRVAQTLTTVHPRMILIDMLLSGRDGRDICKKLKTDTETSQIKIMMMSAHPDADKSCREAGADDFIAKPFDMDHFISKIKDLLGAPLFKQ